MSEKENTSNNANRRATWLELFYDLVFVVVIFQLAHKLEDDISLKGFLGFLALFVPVWWSCRICSACTSGKEYDCRQRQVWGFQTGPLWGGFAQYTYLPEVNVIKIPDNLSFQDAAAISMVGMTSWHMLVTRANIQPGQTVLIMGGGSGMGIAGIQIAKLFNCDVIATAGSQEKMDKCLELGADHARSPQNPYLNKLNIKTCFYKDICSINK